VEIPKRDKRNPGHCWQDNELYDVFQPVLGALPTHVFAVMSRWCYGHEVQMGVREIAARAGVSRSTVQRAMLAMQALNMIRICEGRGRTAATWDLLDLKEAARALGAGFDARERCWTLSAHQQKDARKRIADAWRGAGVCVSDGDAKHDEENSVEKACCVSDRDATGSVVSHVVSQNRGVCVPNRGGLLDIQDTKTLNKNPSPAPSRTTREGVSVSPARDTANPLATRREKATALDESSPQRRGPIAGDPEGAAVAADRVMRECCFGGRRLPKLLGEVLARYAQQLAQVEGEEPDDAAFDASASAMIAAWREYEESKQHLRWVCGPAKFFSGGMWLNADGWPWDRERMERERGARVGAR
jgi:hypothetical protein